MPTNTFFKIKKYINNLFKKKTIPDKVQKENINSESKELIAGGFTMAPEHYIRKYKTKESD